MTTYRDDGAKQVLILESPNPLDLPVEDLEVLAMELRALFDEQGASDYQVKVHAEPPLGTANNFADILILFVPTADFIRTTLWTLAYNRIETFMRNRFDRPHEQTRSRVVPIYDAKGNPIKLVTIKEKTAIAEWSDTDGFREPPTQ